MPMEPMEAAVNAKQQQTQIEFSLNYWSKTDCNAENSTQQLLQDCQCTRQVLKEELIKFRQLLASLPPVTPQPSVLQQQQQQWLTEPSQPNIDEPLATPNGQLRAAAPVLILSGLIHKNS
ncbi:hypothetical protein BOX15_Mlig022839g1 [Macrostomum lignano]|uniref:Uncharacterized protein n=2 Tax=Macrostomum lignano TaxID=282301 RepID=A0A267FAD6_9PLAT|nr:hypothetical protein BOX15_Mlig022839g1 [Macrostomum lignano]